MQIFARAKCHGMQAHIDTAPLLPNALEETRELPVLADIKRQDDLRPQCLGDRADVRFRLVVEIGYGKIGALLAQRPCAAIGNGMVVGDSDDQRLFSGQGE